MQRLELDRPRCRAVGRHVLAMDLGRSDVEIFLDADEQLARGRSIN